MPATLKLVIEEVFAIQVGSNFSNLRVQLSFTDETSNVKLCDALVSGRIGLCAAVTFTGSGRVWGNR